MLVNNFILVFGMAFFHSKFSNLTATFSFILIMLYRSLVVLTTKLIKLFQLGSSKLPKVFNLFLLLFALGTLQDA